jgi:hypothetical protein
MMRKFSLRFGRWSLVDSLWRFLSRHWFTLALIVLTILALWRRKGTIRQTDVVPINPPSLEKTEHYTQRKVEHQPAALVELPQEPMPKGVRLPSVDDATAVAFLQRFSRTAVAEQERFGMPASVLLACAYVNSFAGKRPCAVEANNYLATRCTADWPGAVITLEGVCYRRYQTAWESLRDFNVYYSQKAWYAELKKKAGRDWRKWLKELAAREVSDVAHFETEAARLIEKFRVYELDEPKAGAGR